MFNTVEKREMAPKIKLIKIYAPKIAEKARPGQFVILTIDERGERFPLTLVDWEKNEGTITLIFLEAGVQLKNLVR